MTKIDFELYERLIKSCTRNEPIIGDNYVINNWYYHDQFVCRGVHFADGTSVYEGNPIFVG